MCGGKSDSLIFVPFSLGDSTGKILLYPPRLFNWCHSFSFTSSEVSSCTTLWKKAFDPRYIYLSLVSLSMRSKVFFLLFFDRPSTLKVSMITDFLTWKSKSLSVAKLGAWFTSISQGLAHSSMRTSKPRISKHV